MEEKRVNSVKEIDMSGLNIPLIAVYEHPSDFPDKCVARVYDGARPTDTIMVKNNFSEIWVDFITNSAMRFFPRGAEDVPSLVGTWI